MTTLTLSRKTNSDMLGLIQIYYPQVSSFTWNADGSAVIASTDVLSGPAISDIIQIIIGNQAWDAK